MDELRKWREDKMHSNPNYNPRGDRGGKEVAIMMIRKENIPRRKRKPLLPQLRKEWIRK